VTIPVEGLRAAGLGDEVEKVARGVAGFLDDGTGTNVAVVSEPFAGRESLLDYAEGLLEESTRVRLDDVVRGHPPTVPDEGALIVDDCHYLYRRCIDGYDVIERFLERVAASDALVLTSWNRYSWSYLANVLDVADSFPSVVEIPRLDSEQLRAVVRTHFDLDRPEFVTTDDGGRIKTVEWRRRPARVFGPLTVDVPVPTLNLEYLASWLADEDETELVVFEKLRRLSHGNPGIATSLWERSVEDGADDDGPPTVAPAYLDEPVGRFELQDDDRAMLLWTVVANEAVDRSTLADVTYDVSVDKELQLLAQRDVVTVDDERVRISPVGLHPAVAALDRRRFLW